MFELVRRNQRRSALLVSAMFVTLLAVGYAAGEALQQGTGLLGLLAAVVIFLVMFLTSYFGGDSILLSAAGARLVSRAEAPQLHNVLEEMVIASGLEHTPRLYVIDSPVANAFATGRTPETASVAVTEGLLGLCTRDELQAVIAHELAHIRHRDIVFMMLLAVMAGAVALIADLMTRAFRGGARWGRSTRVKVGGQAQLVLFVVGVLLLIVGAVVARLIFFAASRTREYLADAGAAIFTRNPLALAEALQKISGNVAGAALPVPKVAQAMLIIGPGLFETHPPVSERIAVLRKLAGVGAVSYDKYAAAFTTALGRSAGFVPRAAGDAAPIVARAAVATPDRALRRETLDALKVAAGFRILPCTCGARIKIPPNYPHPERLHCPRCNSALAAA
jgi:heat shock protein HtpX